MHHQGHCVGDPSRYKLKLCAKKNCLWSWMLRGKGGEAPLSPIELLLFCVDGCCIFVFAVIVKFVASKQRQ